MATTKLRITGERLRRLLRLEEGIRVLEVIRTDMDIFKISLDGCPIEGEVTWDQVTWDHAIWDKYARADPGPSVSWLYEAAPDDT